MSYRLTTNWILVIAALSIGAAPVSACPFCAAVKMTFNDEIRGAQAAILAKLVATEPAPAPASDATDVTNESAPTKPSIFEVVHVFKGAELLAGAKTVEVLYFGPQGGAQTYLLIGIHDPTLGLQWGAPTGLTAAAETYVRKLMTLPESRSERLPHILPYLEDPEIVVNQDAYDEFATASYTEIKSIKSHLDRKQLVTWITNPQTQASRKRLYLTLLAVCGTAEEIPRLEEMIRSTDREQRRALDALLACYLTLRGPEGLELVDELFLKNAEAEYTDTYAAIMALRFHGQEESSIPKPRLVESLRWMLDRTKLADLVIPDLARWEDWSVIERLATLFEESKEESNWIRVPVIQYLQACPLPEAKPVLERLSKLDPDAVRRASQFQSLIVSTAPTPNETRAGAAAEKNAAAPVVPATVTTAPAPTPVPTPTASTPAAARQQTPSEAFTTWLWSIPAIAGTVLLGLIGVTLLLLLGGGRSKS